MSVIKIYLNMKSEQVNVHVLYHLIYVLGIDCVNQITTVLCCFIYLHNYLLNIYFIQLSKSLIESFVGYHILFLFALILYYTLLFRICHFFVYLQMNTSMIFSSFVIVISIALVQGKVIIFFKNSFKTFVFPHAAVFQYRNL